MGSETVMSASCLNYRVILWVSYALHVLDEIGLHVGLVLAHDVAYLAPESDLLEHPSCKQEIAVAVQVDGPVHVLAESKLREDKSPLHN